MDAAQKELLGDLDVPVIDMFEMTYEMPELHRPEDSMHYNAEMAIYWADYFLPEGDETASASSYIMAACQPALLRHSLSTGSRLAPAIWD